MTPPAKKISGVLLRGISVVCSIMDGVFSFQAQIDFSRTRNEIFSLPMGSQITGVRSMRDRIGIYPRPSGDEASGLRFRLAEAVVLI